MLHELRTPVNAIQGFAEVIQQQLFGPTPHEYRALAAGIVGDAARMLSAFEELERLARLESGAMELEEGETDLAQLIASTVAQLGAHTKSRGSGFTVRPDEEVLPVPLDRLELERIVWRLLATLAGTSAPGEQLKLRLRTKDHMVRLDLGLPASLNALADDALFEAAAGAVPQVIAAGVFGLGFALRLARAEARAAGGDLVRKGERLRLTLPGLTGALPGHTHSADEDSVGTV
jgi:K+-sensing histidine kinase KdpD